MRLHTMSLFCDEVSDGPTFDAEYSRNDHWPISMSISHPDANPPGFPKIHIFLTEIGFINFKNSVIHAHEEYMKKRVEVVGPYEWTGPSTFEIAMEGVTIDVGPVDGGEDD